MYICICIDTVLTRSCLQNDPSFRQRAFVTDEDIRGISEFQDQTLIAIKAPTGAPHPAP